MKASANPLCLDILQIIHKKNSSISAYDVLKELGDDVFPNDVFSDPSLKLFRQNFYLMNALYQLQVKLADENLYLNISSMDIHIRNLNNTSSNTLAEQSVDLKLSEYYLDWYNYDTTSSKDVDELLNGFWRQYCQYHQHLPSLKVLGLDDRASWPDIQQCYRRLVKTHHPDKGGDKLRFMEIREAYEVLQSIYDV